RQLTAGDGEFYPQSTPDGRWVVYQSHEVIDPRLWKVPTDGGQPVEVTTTRATKPAVSPDGRTIAYSYLDVDLKPSRWGIGIVSTAGGERLRRFDFSSPVVERRGGGGAAGCAGAILADHPPVAFLTRPRGFSDIGIQPLDGSPPKPLTDFKAEPILAFDWAPDGSLASVRNHRTSDVVLLDGR